MNNFKFCIRAYFLNFYFTLMTPATSSVISKINFNYDRTKKLSVLTYFLHTSISIAFVSFISLFVLTLTELFIDPAAGITTS